MDARRHRYPGAQPFSDDDFSRGVFFGRDAASRTLADKILANRLVVVYGRSGLGKTSLLNAGVAPLLRDEGYLPLSLRVNDTQQGALHAVLQQIPDVARRQQVEFTEGLTDSLWSFFKTAEFWRGDLLLTPVLILDQFEELFTLQDAAARARFLDQLSYLIRGVRPPSANTPAHADLSERPPAIRILLSLREDYLGFLEEAADHIPQIFDARFRLSPLDREAAEKAIRGPAQVDDPRLETRPFALDDEAVEAVLDFLSRRRTGIVADARRHVEPFQLQLICSRIEQIAAAKQRRSKADIAIGLADIGGESALTQTLKDFYGDSVRAVPQQRERRAARRLCEEYLISAEGRRLSLEETEIRRQLGLSKETLKQLVASRLIRAESRSDSTYYELSHDALVEPILASQHRKATVRGWFGVTFGALLFLFFTVLLLLSVVGFFVMEFEEDFSARIWEIIGAIVMLAALVMFLGFSVTLLRNSARTLVRHRRAREAARIDPDQALSQRGSLLSGLFGLTVSVGFVLVGLVLLVVEAILVWAWFDYDAASQTGDDLDIDEFMQIVVENGIGLDLSAYIVAAVALIWIAGRMARWGVLRMARYPMRKAVVEPRVDETVTATGRRGYAASRRVVGGICLAAAVVLAVSTVLLAGCGWLAPLLGWEWVRLPGFSFLDMQCAPGYDSLVEDLIANSLLAVCCWYVGWPLLRRGRSARGQQVLATSD